MSIHPQYAQAILDGRKKVEFRKRRIAEDVTHVVVYATAPISAVVGIFRVSGQTTEAPTSLWRRFKDVAGISRAGFNDYFAGREHATGIEVGQVTALDVPLCVREDLGLQRPPQSFQYLRHTELPTDLVPVFA